jgi:hypothetical protein
MRPRGFEEIRDRVRVGVEKAGGGWCAVMLAAAGPVRWI